MGWMIIAGLVALALSLALNRLMLVLAPRLGLMDHPGERRIHSGVIPRAGGLAIWVSFLVVSCGAVGFFGRGEMLSWSWLGGFAAGSGVLMVAGVLDDRFGLRPLVKLGAHILAPVVMFWVHPLTTGFFAPGVWWVWDLLLFVGWSVVLINAFNLIDGLDGLCGGLATVACLAMAGLAMANGRPDAAVVLWLMGAALLGFLWFNMNPARIFLGDAGSMMLGFFLATAATGGVGRKTVLGVLLLPIAVAGVPLLDVLLAVWRRWMRRWAGRLRGEDEAGKGIFDADREHLHHRLLDAAGSQRKVALMLQLLAVALAALCLLPMIFGDRMIRVSLVGLLLLGLAAVRHLARVEIVHTGEVLHLAIKLPVKRRQLAVGMFCYDLLALVLAGGAAILMETNLLFNKADWDRRGIALFMTVFVVCGMLALLGARVHQRLWVRVSLRDFVGVVFWFVMCGLVTFSVVSLGKASVEWSVLRLTVLACAGGCLAVCLPRVMLDLVREMAMVHRVRSAASDRDMSGYGPVAVVGAGDVGTLFLEHLKATGSDTYVGMRMLGFLDENESLHGRTLRSFPILGSLDKVPELIASQGLRGLVVAINRPGEDLLARLEELSVAHGLTLYRWTVGMQEWRAEK